MLVKDRIRLDHFRDAGDPREATTVKYPLPHALFLVICASVKHGFKRLP